MKFCFVQCFVHANWKEIHNQEKLKLRPFNNFPAFLRCQVIPNCSGKCSAFYAFFKQLLLRQQTSQKLLLIGWKKSRRLKFPSNEHTTVRQKTGRNLIGLNISFFSWAMWKNELSWNQSLPETPILKYVLKS